MTVTGNPVAFTITIQEPATVGAVKAPQVAPAAVVTTVTGAVTVNPAALQDTVLVTAEASTDTLDNEPPLSDAVPSV